MNPNHRAILLVVALALAGCESSPRSASSSPLPAADLSPVSNPVPALPGDVYEISKVSIVPAVVYEAAPEYPDAMSARKIPGEAQILFTVMLDGSVGNIVVVSATNRFFGESAANAIRQWRFHPAQVNHEAVKCRMPYALQFNASVE